MGDAASERDTTDRLRDFGFEPPVSNRWAFWYQFPILSGGREGRRRFLLGLFVTSSLLVALVALARACGSDGACSWAPLLVLGLLCVQVLVLAFQWWFLAAVPASFANPRHPDAGPGQFGAGQRTFPSQDVIFDPTYGRRDPPS